MWLSPLFKECAATHSGALFLKKLLFVLILFYKLKTIKSNMFMRICIGSRRFLPTLGMTNNSLGRKGRSGDSI